MNLAQVMAAHGKTLGPLGVAVYAWIEANPGATFKEVADGMDMGESTVKRCVRQFEEIGIARRLIETTPKGLALPTRIYPGTIERGTSDNPVPSETPLQQNPVTIESPGIIEESLSDPGTIERGTFGTKVAPSKAIRTSTDTPQPSVEGDADAPPPPPKKVRKAVAPKAEGPMAKLSDAERAVLDEWRSLTKAYPPEYAWPTIFERILDGFDAARFKRCGGAYLTHIGRGQRYVGGVLDWYQRNQTEPEERNGNGKVATGQFGKPEVTRDYSKFPRRAG